MHRCTCEHMHSGVKAGWKSRFMVAGGAEVLQEWSRAAARKSYAVADYREALKGRTVKGPSYC